MTRPTCALARLAAIRADAMLEKDDLDGQRVWKAIVRAIEELQRGGRKEGEPLQ